MIYFITSSKNKFEEVKSVVPKIEQFEMDLPEIQEVDAKAIIEAKLKEALKHKKGEFIVEDTSLYFDCLNGLPGPLIKWFLKSLGNNGLAKLAERMGDNKAEAKTIIGYADDKGTIHFFEGAIKGRIIKPRGEANFGWDPIFLPDGYDKNFAEMSREEKNKISMRREAANKLKEFLQMH